METDIMADVLSEEQRRRNMRRIRGKDTKPEIILRKALWHRGYRYRKNYSKLPGKPDIVLTKHRLCVFIDSEFFHGKGFECCYDSAKYASLREQIEHGSHPGFWLNKIQRNTKSIFVLPKYRECVAWFNDTIQKQSDRFCEMSF